MLKTLSNEADNILRWDGKKRGFYEVYYLKCNDIEKRRAYWMRYTLTSPVKGGGEPICELWAIAFDIENPKSNYAHKLTLPIESLQFEKERFLIRVGEHELTNEGCNGSLGEGDKKIEWNLRFEGENLPTFRHFPTNAMYSLALPKTKVLAPRLSMKVSGDIESFGEKRSFEGLPGHQAHIWGTKHAARWAWANCNSFVGYDEGVVFEALSAQIKVGAFVVPHLSLFYLKAGEEEYLFNSLYKLVTNYSSYDILGWNIEAEGGGYRLKAVIESSPVHMVGVTYRDPDGEERICNNSKVADMKIKLERFEKGLWVPYREFEATPNSVAYEVVDGAPHPDVSVMI